jgi:hypothetical protein
MFLTADAAAFFAVWQGLRTDAEFPHYRSVFQQFPSHLIPRLMVLEEGSPGQFIVRFVGTERALVWDEEITGKDIIALLIRNVGQAAARNLRTMIDHPCGMSHIARFVTSLGTEAKMENITLPVNNDAGLPRRLINFSQETEVMLGKVIGKVVAVTDRAWIDVGFGVPAKPPKK